MSILQNAVGNILANMASELEVILDGDVISYTGPITPGVERQFRQFIEATKVHGTGADRLICILTTHGGSVEVVEKLVEIIRFHYSEVFFIVPSYAMSAGTIWCMSGDKIYMDYASSLGPIDPQIFNGKEWVPALGYLDQVDKMIEKSKANQLTDAELIIFQSQDLAMLSRLEQAKNLTITLLKRWLVDFKFKDWVVHETTPEKIGKEVTCEEKRERAEVIALMLADNKIWHSHGRMIGVSTLQSVLKLKIEDYSENHELRAKINNYSDLIQDYLSRHEYAFFLHSKAYF